MRHESYVTFLSWIPSEAATGAARVAFGTGPARYDNPPPGEPGDFDGLRQRTGSVPPTFCGPGSRWLTPDSWSGRPWRNYPPVTRGRKPAGLTGTAVLLWCPQADPGAATPFASRRRPLQARSRGAA